MHRNYVSEQFANNDIRIENHIDLINIHAGTGQGESAQHRGKLGQIV